MRAVLTLPDSALFKHSADPGGDLLAGRHDALAAAELEAIGIRWSGSSGGDGRGGAA